MIHISVLNDMTFMNVKWVLITDLSSGILYVGIHVLISNG